ncbi:phosphohistidine phosphatase, SixA [Labilithrix luteola]|uniref:Phosphohistidine phosphatase, SixA n=1 Tax=Labilithrix luteola TaxID=1391654 RepID=A0A0K1PS11_9BACT|nr:histidine phosphatase family protein [Labilithrix luteola]AKU95914.1 phosphohistidine phosphatase, SixA [Labilithrix luteola]
MKLYVMRHGPAEDDSPTGRDADRALTPTGRDRVRHVARALLEGGEAPFIVLSSPLVRALQTAEIVASITGLDRRVADEKKARASGGTGAVEVRREMAPGGDTLGLVGELARAGRKRVMVVGHEPDLSLLVSRLIGRLPSEGMLKAMVVGVKLTPTAPEVQGSGFTSKSRFVLDPKTLAWQRD